jgi:DNA-binding CsgD family transcriptional regulator
LVPDPDPAAHLEHSLLRAHALINSMVLMQRRNPPLPLPVTWSDADEVARAMEQATRYGRHSVVGVLAGVGEFADMVLPSLRRVPHGRLLCPAAAVEAVANRVQPLPLAPECLCEVRVSDQALRSILIVDDAVAFVPGPAGARVRAVKDDDAIASLKLVFEAAWAGSRRLAGQIGFGQRLGTELGQRILYHLCSGRTDEAAARCLHVSLRTYRRYVADIMRELEISSRFQAGVRAFELGLLPGEETGPEPSASAVLSACYQCNEAHGTGRRVRAA